MASANRNSVELRLCNAANRAETLLELVDPAFGIHKLLLSSEERMGVGGDADRNQAVLYAIDDFLLFGGFGRARNETSACGHIHKDDRIVFRMKVLFHEVDGVLHVSNAAERRDCRKKCRCQASQHQLSKKYLGFFYLRLVNI